MTKSLVERLRAMCDQVGHPDYSLAKFVAGVREAAAALEGQRDAWPEELHPETADLVRRFTIELGKKLYVAQCKYGYSDGWLANDWMDECRAKLREHVEKGDPRDVAAYCAFLWHHGQSTARPSAPSTDAQDAVRLAAIPQFVFAILWKRASKVPPLKDDFNLDDLRVWCDEAIKVAQEDAAMRDSGEGA